MSASEPRSADPVTDARAQAAATLGVRDRSQRQRADIELARFEAIVNSSDDAIITVNRDGVFDSWNPAAERIFGYSADQALGRPADILRPAEVAEEGRKNLRRVLAGESVRFHQTVRLHRDGTRVEVSLTASPLREANGSVVGALAIIRDCTARNASERRLQEAQTLFERAFENAPIGMALVDIDGRYRMVNRAQCKLMGRSERELLALDVLSVTFKDDRETDQDCVRRLLAGEAQSCEFEKRYLRPDGSLQWVQVAVSLVPSASGESVRFVRQIQDITARKTVEDELRTHREHLARLTRGQVSVGGDSKKRSDPIGFNGRGPDAAIGRSEIEPVLERARDRLGMDLAYAAEFEDDQQVFRAIAGDASSFGVERGTRAPLEGTYARRIANAPTGGAVYDAHVSRRMDFPITTEGNIGSYVGVPLRFSDGRLYGTLCCVSHLARPKLAGREVELLEVLAGVIADRLERQEGESDERQAAIEFAGIQALVSALEARDHYTRAHSLSVVRLAGAVARRMRLADDRIREVEQVAMLHDVGKVGIPDSILQKRGPLSEVEWELMRAHPAVGAQIVAGTESLAHLASAVGAEHERWDGKGYPQGLCGTEIPIASRITFACDAYHAMTSDRPYRAAMSREEALGELEAGAGSQFDPDVAAALVGVLGGGRRNPPRTHGGVGHRVERDLDSEEWWLEDSSARENITQGWTR